MKLIVILQLKDHVLVQPDVGLDTTAYVDLAKRVLAGDLALGPGQYYVSPLYIYVLAAGLAIGDSFTAVRILQALLGTAAVGLIFLTARAWFGGRAAWLAAGLAALTGLFTFYEALLLQAALDPFLTAAALYALTVAITRPSTRWLLIAGIIFGVATLNRPNMAIGAAGVVLALLATRRVRPAAVLVAGLTLGLAPVMIRNAVVTGEWTFASSQGGLNFYIGNNATATGFYQQVPGITPNIAGQATDARRVAEQALGRPLTDAETSSYFFGRAWDWIRQHPADAIGLFFRKLGWVLSAPHVALPYSFPFFAYDANTMLRFYAIGPWLLLPLGVVGLTSGVISSRRRKEMTPEVLLPFVLAYAVGVAAFFVAERYRLPLLVPLCIGAGAALEAVWRAVSAKEFKALVVPGMVFAVAFALANWRPGIHDGRLDEGLRMAERLITLGRYTEAEPWVRQLVSQAPRPAVIHFHVGRQFLIQGQTTSALEHLTKAHELDRGQPNVEYVFGQALLRAGRASDAVMPLRTGFEAGAQVPLAGYDLAVALQELGDLAGAASVIRRITPGVDDAAEAWLKVGRLAALVKAPDVAEPFFQQAVRMRPGDAAARQQLGLNLLLLGRNEDAVRELAEAVRLDPRDQESLAHLAYGEMKLGRIADARTHAARALALQPDHELANQLMAALGRIK